MNVSEIITSSDKPYKVKFITSVNPHIFWLEPILENIPGAEDHNIIQAGLANVFPTDIKPVEPVLQIQRYSSIDWIPAGSRLLEKIVSESEEVYFLPQHVMPDKFSVINNVPCIFGELFVVQDSNLKSMVKILSDSGVLYKCTKRFQKYLKSGKVFIDLSGSELDIVVDKAIQYANEQFRSLVENEANTSEIRKLVRQYKRELNATLDKEEGEKNRMLRNMEQVYDMCIKIDEEASSYKSARGKDTTPAKTPATNSITEDEQLSQSSESTVLMNTPNVKFLPAGARIESPARKEVKKKKKHYSNQINDDTSQRPEAVPHKIPSVINSSIGEPSDKRLSLGSTSSQNSSSSYNQDTDLEASFRSNNGQSNPDTSPSDMNMFLKRKLNKLSSNKSEVSAVSCTRDLKLKLLGKCLSSTQDTNTSPSAHQASKMKFLSSSLLNASSLQCPDVYDDSESSVSDTNSVTSTHNLRLKFLNSSLKKPADDSGKTYPSDEGSVVSSVSVTRNKKLQFLKDSIEKSDEKKHGETAASSLVMKRKFYDKKLTAESDKEKDSSSDVASVVSTTSNAHQKKCQFFGKNLQNVQTKCVQFKDNNSLKSHNIGEVKTGTSVKLNLYRHTLAASEHVVEESDEAVSDKEDDVSVIEFNIRGMSVEQFAHEHLQQPVSPCEEMTVKSAGDAEQHPDSSTVKEKSFSISPESDPELITDSSEESFKENYLSPKSWKVSSMVRCGVEALGIKAPLPNYGGLVSPVAANPEPNKASSAGKKSAFQVFRESSSYFAEGDLIEKVTTPKVIIHNKNGEASVPVVDLESSHFLPIILKNLKSLGVTVPSKLQSSVWPMAFGSRSLFVVGSVSSGRGLSVLAPICNKLPKIVLSELPEGVGPVAMIVCPDSFAANKVYASSKMLLKDCVTIMGNELKVIKIDDWNDSNHLYRIVNGVDVLVITSRCLYQFLNYEVTVINLDRMLYLVFEDLDTLNEQFHDETKRIIDTCLTSRESNTTKLQVYATSQVWCELLERLAKECYNPTVVIGALQECLFYSKPEINVTFCKEDNKLKKLESNFENADPTFRRILIVCDGDEEISQVNGKLKDTYITYVADATTIDELNETRKLWESHDLRTGSVIMITYDENLHFLGINDVHWLVHFSLSKTYAQFNYRFSSMANNYPNLYEQNSKRTPLKVDLFISENDLTRLPKLTTFISRFNIYIPAEVRELLKDIIKIQDIFKADIDLPLCERFSAFGYCSDTWGCIERHSLVANDYPHENLPRVGKVKCTVIAVHHATLFSARLLEYTSSSGVKHTLTQSHITLLFELAAYFAAEGNRKCHGDVKCGDKCAIKMVNDYKRCQVLRIIPTSNKATGDIIRVNLLDEERYLDVKRHELLHLPDRLKELRSTVVKIRLAGVVPSEDDNFWSTSAIDNVKSLLSSHKDLLVQGSIVLGIRNTLWLDDIQIVRHLQTLNIDVIKCNLKRNLLVNGFAVENPHHLTILHDFCKSFNFSLPDLEGNVPRRVSKKRPTEVQWAHLSEDFTNVYFSYADSLGLFYIRHEAFCTLLTDLENDLQGYVNKLKSNWATPDLKITAESIQQGLYCAALFVDEGTFNRAKVLENVTNKDGSELYKCFFVDHGEIRTVRLEDIYLLTEDFIKRLPFQAIECRMFGMAPTEDTWKGIETEKLYDFSFVGDSDDLKILVCKFYTKERATYTGGHKYGVTLIDCSTKMSFPDVVLGESLVQPVQGEMELIRRDDESIQNLFQYADNVEEVDDGDKSDSALRELGVVEWTDDETDDEWDCEFYKEDYETLLKRDHLPRLCAAPEKEKTKEKSLFRMDGDVRRNVPVIEKKGSFKTPRILWHQTKEHVTIKVMLADVHLYECSIGPKSLYFETTIDRTRYKLDIELAACVKQESSYYVTKGMYVFIRIYKHISMVWETLTAANSIVNTKLIVYDPDFVFVEDDSDSDVEEHRKFKELIKSRVNAMDDENLDDGSEDDQCEDVKTLEAMESDPINRQIIKLVKKQMAKEKESHQEESSDSEDELIE